MVGHENTKNFLFPCPPHDPPLSPRPKEPLRRFPSPRPLSRLVIHPSLSHFLFLPPSPPSVAAVTPLSAGARGKEEGEERQRIITNGEHPPRIHWRRRENEEKKSRGV